jgi:integrase
MPTFLPDRKRNPWRAQARRKGFKTEVAYFPTEDEAKEWEEMRRGALRRKAKGLPADIAELQKITIGDMVVKYLKEETAYKSSAETETYRLNNFLSYSDFRTRPLIAFHRPDAIAYRNYLEREYKWEGKTFLRKKDGQVVTPNRKSKSVKPGTIRRHIAILRDMWNVAVKDWKGYESLKEIGNPWSGVSSTKRPKKRTRRLDDLPVRTNELDKLLEASNQCRGINKVYMRLAINLAVQTGMRQQEILLLNWDDVNIHTGRIIIRKSKTDYKSDVDGRTIVMPFFAKIYFTQAWAALFKLADRGDYLTLDKRIFQMKNHAFRQAWIDLVSRAEINTKEQDEQLGIIESQRGLEFRDLRREAGSRFDEAGLTKAEHDLMLGHESRDIAGIYIAPALARIEKKIEEYWSANATIAADAETREQFRNMKPGFDGLFEILMAHSGISKSVIEDVIKLSKEVEVETKQPEEIAPDLSNVIPFVRKSMGV